MKKNKLALILIISSLLLIAVGFAIAYSTPSQLALAIETTVESEEATNNAATLDSIKDAAKEIYNTQIAPLFVGASGTSLLSIILSIINSKTAKKTAKDTDKKVEVVTTNMTTKANSIMEWAKQLQLEVSTQNQVTKETMDRFLATAASLKADAEKVVSLGQKQEKTNQLLATVTSVLIKYISINKEVIKSGLGEELVTMTQQLQELMNK